MLRPRGRISPPPISPIRASSGYYSLGASLRLHPISASSLPHSVRNPRDSAAQVQHNVLRSQETCNCVCCCCSVRPSHHSHEANFPPAFGGRQRRRHARFEAAAVYAGVRPSPPFAHDLRRGVGGGQPLHVDYDVGTELGFSFIYFRTRETRRGQGQGAVRRC